MLSLFVIIFILALTKTFRHDSSMVEKITRRASLKSLTSKHKLRNIPNVLVIGVQKAGTTYLGKLLHSQDEIYSYLGEAHYFRERENTLEGYSKRLRSYNSYRQYHTNPEIIHKPIIVEKTPNYILKMKKIVSTMSNNTKYVVTLRNPIDRAYSNYKMNQRAFKYKTTNPNTTLRQWAKEISSFEDFIENFQPNGAVNPIKRGHYALQLEEWFSTVPADKILILIYENFYKYDWSILGSFLGMKKPFKVEPKPNPPKSYKNDIKKETYERLERELKPHNKRLCVLLRKYGYKCPAWAIYD